MINLWRSIRVTVVFAVLLGLVYPLLITGVSSLVFPFQAEGSLVEVGGVVVGSQLIAQATPSAGLFQPRPSAVNYAANNSGAANLGPTNPALVAAVRASLISVLRSNPGVRVGQVPIGMVETSGSGLDPDISIAAARLQVPRIARASGVSTSFLYGLIDREATGRTLGMWGEPMVNVMRLNEGVLKARGTTIGKIS